MNFKTGEIFAIDKPYGITSFKALAHVRYVLSHTLGHRVKIGHAGTLDPLATGVLILCTGKCTKQIETLQAHTKEYEATLPKNIHIDSIEITRFDPDTMQLDLRIVCGKGTYIRALARDLGRALGSGAYLTQLRRTRVGEYDIDKCIEYDHFQEWLDNQEIETSNETVTV